MIEERRRAPRYDVAGDQLAVLPVSMSVRVLDISLSGVLLESRQPAKEGSRARLRLNVGGVPFSADVEIRRVTSTGVQGSHQLGAMFVDLAQELKQIITRFTQR